MHLSSCVVKVLHERIFVSFRALQAVWKVSNFFLFSVFVLAGERIFGTVWGFRNKFSNLWRSTMLGFLRRVCVFLLLGRAYHVCGSRRLFFICGSARC